MSGVPGLALRRVAKYFEVLRVTLQNRLAYFQDQLFRATFMALVVFVFIQLWRTTYRVTGRPEFSGFDLNGMIWYLVMTETIITSTPRFQGRIDSDVRSGDLAYALSKPYNYLAFNYFGYLGEALFLLPINLIVGGTVAWLSVGGFRFEPLALPAAFASVVLSLSINFFLAAAVGLLAFWLEDTAGLFLVLDRAQWILGGLLLPIELFPTGLRKLAQVLPFGSVIGGPARLAVKFSWTGFGDLVPKQLAWLAVLALLAHGIYRAGVRRVNANGG